MSAIRKVLISIVFGIIFYAVLVVTCLRPFVPFALKKVFLWNIILLNSVGRQKPLWYLPDGTPVYDGNFGVMGFSWQSVLSGFVIYPILIFIGISIFEKLLRRLRKAEAYEGEPPPPPKFE